MKGTTKAVCAAKTEQLFQESQPARPFHRTARQERNHEHWRKSQSAAGNRPSPRTAFGKESRKEAQKQRKSQREHPSKGKHKKDRNQKPSSVGGKAVVRAL